MATNMFIKYEGPATDGGSSSKGHETETEVVSWNHGFNQPTSPVRSASGGGTIEKCNHSHFTYTKEMDSATPDELKLCWSGKHIDKITFRSYRSSGDTGGGQMGVTYLTIVMEHVVISDISFSAGIGSVPLQTISLNYGKVTYTYNPQERTKGTVGADKPVSHDLTTHVVA